MPEPEAFPGEPQITEDDYARLCEELHESIREFGLLTVLASLQAAIWHRAHEQPAKSPHYYLHTRTASGIMALIHDRVLEADRIVAGENPYVDPPKG